MAFPTTIEERVQRLADSQARQRDAALARQEYEDKRGATLLKTERLRLERLEREAAAAKAEAASKSIGAAKAPKSTRAGKAPKSTDAGKASNGARR